MTRISHLSHAPAQEAYFAESSSELAQYLANRIFDQSLTEFVNHALDSQTFAFNTPNDVLFLANNVCKHLPYKKNRCRTKNDFHQKMSFLVPLITQELKKLFFHIQTLNLPSPL